MLESQGPFDRKQRFLLLSFYISSLVLAVAVGLLERLASVYRLPLLGSAAIAAICGAFSLFQFFRTTDEFRESINRRAVEFAFVATLIASVALALLHTLGMREVTPYALPALMVILWSMGLFFSARRFE